MCKDGAESLVRAGREGARDVPPSTISGRNTQIREQRSAAIGRPRLTRHKRARGRMHVHRCVTYIPHQEEEALYYNRRVTPQLQFKHREREFWGILGHVGLFFNYFFFWMGGLCGMMTQCVRAGMQAWMSVRWSVLSHMGTGVTFFCH